MRCKSMRTVCVNPLTLGGLLPSYLCAILLDYIQSFSEKILLPASQKFHPGTYLII